MVTGDGRKGYEPDGPYDAIHVGAAAPILPQDVSMNKKCSNTSSVCLSVNRFPNNPWFLCVCSISLLKTLLERRNGS